VVSLISRNQGSLQKVLTWLALAFGLALLGEVLDNITRYFQLHQDDKLNLVVTMDMHLI
jgi:hypothetical protein